MLSPAIRRSDGVIALVSKNSLISSGQKWEISFAKEREEEDPGHMGIQGGPHRPTRHEHRGVDLGRNKIVHRWSMTASPFRRESAYEEGIGRRHRRLRRS
jgi:hypothetical protein